MPFDFSKRKEKLAANTKPLTIDVDGEPLNVIYRRAQITAGDTRRMSDMVRDARKADKENDQTRAAELNLATLEMKQDRFLSIVVEWDAVSNGVPIPLTREGLEEHDVDHDMMDFILARIAEDQRPNPPTAPR